MKIAKDCVVTIDYVLKNTAGEILDSSQKSGDVAYIHGQGNLLEALEAKLEGEEPGSSVEVSLKSEEAYGARDEGLVVTVPKTEFPKDHPLEPGLDVYAQTEEGTQVYTILEVGEDSVVLDGNHPLTGMDLFFQVKIIDVRDATKEELEHGHVHGPNHHHDDHGCDEDCGEDCDCH